ncbi:MAG: hypothetical protein WCS89_02630 [Candidatus Paceibacterota bacterium]|jgi:beta-lactamase superfamily II metal-dependent hydrolase
MNISKPLVIAVASTALASGLGGYVWKESSRPPILEIYIFSLSNGRSMFIRTPEDKRILIDGGPNSEIIRELTKIIPFYSHYIDMIMATNTDGKNVSGLIDVVERYKVNQAFVPAVTLETVGLASSTDQIYSTFIDTLNIENIKTDKVLADDNIVLDGKVSIKSIFPIKDSDFTYSKTSSPEVLFNISFGSTNITFLGSASNKTQRAIVFSPSSTLGDADVLVVSHSALPENIYSQLINEIKPEYLVYSRKVTNKSTVLRAKAKKEVIDPLAYIKDDKKFNLKEKGTVKITSDGKTVKVVNWE